MPKSSQLPLGAAYKEEIADEVVKSADGNYETNKHLDGDHTSPEPMK